MFPAIFLDRDGVLIENRADYVRDWSHVRVFPESIHALSDPRLANYKIVIVTNQSGVGRGVIPLQTAIEINDRLTELIRTQNGRLDGVYLCPHGPKDNCECRKPKPGLLCQAAQDLSLNLKRSWMIGDAWSDVQAGQAAGVRGTIIVKTGRGKEQLVMPRPQDIMEDLLICEDLPQALSIILARD